MVKAESLEYPLTLQRLPDDAIPPPREGAIPPVEIWRSRHFLVQVYDHGPHMERLSVNKTDIDLRTRRWSDRITWDELMEVKRQVGRGDKDAVEAYPADEDIVNVANMRHLFVFKEHKASFFWRKGER